MNTSRVAFLILGVIAAIPTLLMCCAGMLGIAGVLADVGPAENRRLGVQALMCASVPATVSVVFLVLALFRKSDRRDP